MRGEDQPRMITDPFVPARTAAVRCRQICSGSSGPGPRRRGPGYAVALSWVASPRPHHGRPSRHQPGENFAEFREAAALLSAPSQNLVYADTAGNIGYQLPGWPAARQG